jgi:hypothetical protein
MLFMVIERFKQGDPRDPQPIRERFPRQGRMLPDGLMYHASWVDTTGRRCYQVTEASQVASLAPWMERWKYLIDSRWSPC